MEGVAQFKYLGKTLDQSNDEWMEICQNIRRARKVWGNLGDILQREGADIYVLNMLY